MNRPTPPHRWARSATLLATWALCSATWATGSTAPSSDANAQARRWIAEMKDQPRGPFSGIKWFCRDGRVLPPKDYACAGKNQGWQHGEWNERARALRAQGLQVATLLAGIDADKAIAADGFPDQLSQWLVEKYLVAADSGWILRRAQFYRGAIQEEDEREGARRLLTALAGQPAWAGQRFLALRTSARLLPHGADDASAQQVRNLAAALADRDASFQPLRVKIHGSPGAADAAAVRAWADKLGNTPADTGRAAQARQLATEIDRVYAPRPFGQTLAEAERAFQGAPALRAQLRAARDGFAPGAGADAQLQASARLLVQLREALPTLQQPALRLRLLDLSLRTEDAHFRAAADLRAGAAKPTRAALVGQLQAAADAAYGTGLIGARQRNELARSFNRLAGDEVQLGEHLAALRSLGLVPGWGTQALRLQFGDGMDALAAVEPMAALFLQDQVRGSPLLFYSQRLDMLSRDANRLAGVQHKLMGQEIGTGFSALNPGLARGVLHAAPDMRAVESFRADGIYLLPETVSDLPPLAGILTAGAGNPLSHVQLLARNLGIPNVAVDAGLLPDVKRHDGKPVVLAVSRAGLVEINADGPQWDAAFGPKTAQAAESAVMFEPDVAKLDLNKRDFISLAALRATDSGRLVGPKAAKLGELMSHFPDRVAPGVAIPFGLYREAVLDRPYKATGKTVYQWMVDSFRQLEALPAGSAEAARFSEQLRAEIYRVVSTTDPGPQFRERLRAAMARELGANFNGGVFIRSDTNVEDLPGFTGAGLNLTLFHVVGFEKIMQGIAEVWASPYTARAWAWRQSHMKGPEHVYPAVLLLRTVPAAVSGVMVTQDVDSGDARWLSLAVNEGVGGAVDGQASESLRVDRQTGDVRLMAVATASRRLVPQATGGIARRSTSGAETLLQPNEIAQLIAFADAVPRQFPQRGEDGKPVAADVEFAFVDGKMWLLQIRPFNESRQARGAAHLAEMDKALAGNLGRRINLKDTVQ